MTLKTIGDIAIIHSDTPFITDGQSALDLTATVYYEQGIAKMAISKEAISEDFFKLSTGIAGEVAPQRCTILRVGKALNILPHYFFVFFMLLKIVLDKGYTSYLTIWN